MIVVYYLDDSGSKFAYHFRSPMGLDLVRCFCFAEALISFLRKLPRERRAEGKKRKHFILLPLFVEFAMFFLGGTIGTTHSESNISKIIMEVIGCSLESCQCGSLFLAQDAIGTILC